MLPPCAAHERSSLVQMRASKGGAVSSWLQEVSLAPPIDEDRDRRAFVSLLGYLGFAEYLQQLVDSRFLLGSDNADRDVRRDFAGQSSTPRSDHRLFRLESLLRSLCDERSNGAFESVNYTVERYRDLLRENLTDADETAAWDRFLATWDVIREGMMMP